MKSRQLGFSLVELLIVVAIILILAVVAIPNYLNSRIAANEASAVQSVRTIVTSEVAYYDMFGAGYSSQLSDLGQAGPVTPTSAGLIDPVLAGGVKSGFSFIYAPGAQDADGRNVSFALHANPMVHGASGRRYFYTDQTGAIHQNASQPASPSDPPL